MKNFMKIGFGLSVFAIVALALSCKTETYENGAALYKSQCANCHMETGVGLGELIPTLVQSDYLKNNRAALACILQKGLNKTIVVNGKVYSDQPMPANDKLKAADIANILNYVGTHFGNTEATFTVEEINQQLAHCE
ncbi:MAG: hypothetical protein RL757_2671 [Bacteroidota bacterium]|jgi:mono/diheme cytochrome c family protein